ncbi:hypothetical protein CKF54_00925 [Psittacicella hinzii]|uniref:Uncharacterized protein n=1 Tax=Psittacicella hinzii TaxID=2028575 RepID=A0A3A1YAG7_9GAMM|nr:hypothetical protein CKF54_00925 [Psittacicella hinzii]
MKTRSALCLLFNFFGTKKSKIKNPEIIPKTKRFFIDFFKIFSQQQQNTKKTASTSCVQKKTPFVWFGEAPPNATGFIKYLRPTSPSLYYAFNVIN